VKAREYELMLMAVEDGVDLGYNSAHKYTDTPVKAHLKDCLRREVINQICNWFEFDEQSDESW